VVVAFAAWPIGRLLWAARYDLPISSMATSVIVVCLTLALLATAIAGDVARRRGVAALSRLG